MFASLAIEQIASVRAALQEHGIASWIENEHAPYLVIGLPTAAVPFVIVVAGRDGETARQVIAGVLKYREEHRVRPEEGAPET